jgi:sugar lactone lactonase YvrE
MYSVDTIRRTVYARRYDPADGAVGERRVHVRTTHGYPDGIATDAADHLWVAIWGAGEIQRFAPDGRLVERHDVPAPHTSSVAFVDEDLRLLVITTAVFQLTDEQLRANPDSGRLFTLRVDVPGLPVTPWAGFTSVG